MFKLWLIENEEKYWEMSSLTDADVSHINFTPLENDNFDEEFERSVCRRNVRYDINKHDFFTDVYDDHLDDPDFDYVSPENWEDENPAPDENDYHTEEFDKAYAEWEKEKDDYDEFYEKKVEQWHKKNEEKTAEAEAAYQDKMDEEIENCVEEKRQEYERDLEKGFQHSFTIDNEKFNIRFTDLQYGQDESFIEKCRNLGLDKTEVKNVIGKIYSIEFNKNDEYHATKENKNYIKIYSQLILAVKKLIETESVGGLSFSGYERGMNLIYEKFYKTFLKKHFTIFSDKLYLKNEAIKQIMKLGNKFHKIEIANHIKDTQKTKQKNLDLIRNEKILNIKIKTNYQNMLNKVVKIDNINPNYNRLAIPITPFVPFNGIHVYLLTLDDQLNASTYTDKFININRAENSQELHDFIKDILKYKDKEVELKDFTGEVYNGWVISDENKETQKMENRMISFKEWQDQNNEAINESVEVDFTPPDNKYMQSFDVLKAKMDCKKEMQQESFDEFYRKFIAEKEQEEIYDDKPELYHDNPNEYEKNLLALARKEYVKEYKMMQEECVKEKAFNHMTMQMNLERKMKSNGI